MFALKRFVVALLTLGIWVHPTLERTLEVTGNHNGLHLESNPANTVTPSPECYSFVESRSSHLLYTGNSSVGNVPILEYKVTELTSFDSEFELRTLDPEGVIFFGDIGGQQNYFLLAVIHGNLSVQTSFGDGQILVTSGPQISDGEWKKIAVMKHEGAVAVRVGSEAAVTVQQSAESQRAEIGNGVLRISIGDLLPDSGVTLGLNPPLDGCMRSWDWVRQDSSILERTLQDSEVQRCWEHIAPGSYFTGVGCVGFSSLVLLGNSSDGADWTLSVELALRTVSARGFLFILVDTQNDYILSLKLNHPSQRVCPASTAVSRLRSRVSTLTLTWQRSNTGMSALTAALPPSTSEMGSKGAAVTPDTAYKTTQGYTVFCLAIVCLSAFYCLMWLSM
ncbi:vitamin K-dependent protein S isoform X3 [Salmo salar]|uniref:Vitamin K-dependent protein S isoform X3 n=1 Tax=Salmo salar TaxID=8030 RepID=A0A1S3SYD8_SALSA|nr:vitamin K-dependent protein S isoform X3 [Salmo salar]|eukprot:XP_014069347.1 PREDICTED: vitamin K-dependent protein S-like isoform X3 [Salmo salar]